MKNILFIICFVLCNTFAVAQTSRYFDVKVTPTKISKHIELTPKNISDVRPKNSGHCNNSCICKNEDTFNKLVTSIVKSAFKGIDQEDISLLKQFKFSFTFDSSMKIVYFRFTFYEKYADRIMKLEKNMYDLSQKFLYMDISPYFEVEDSSLFQYAQWTIPLYNLFTSEPSKQ